MVAPGGIWNIRLVKPDQNGQFHFYTISSGTRWLGQKVDLRAECKSDRLIFYIDGEKMASLHDEIAWLEVKLADPELFARDPKGFEKAMSRHQKAKAEMTQAEEHWLELEMLKEELEAN